MERFGYRIASVLLVWAALWVLDVHVGVLRLLAGGVLICISLGLWDAAAKRS
jgi:hypothetical protein